ncbi:MAG: hypothetical protein ACI87W_000349 [Halieaceae bacterium]|jgi:hypothetical protein
MGMQQAVERYVQPLKDTAQRISELLDADPEIATGSLLDIEDDGPSVVLDTAQPTQA